jgi:hypothetical protein
MNTATREDLVLALAQFEADHGHVVTNALENQARHMRETAAACEAALAAPPQPQPAAEDGSTTISLMPTPAGWRGMARTFTEAADKADAALAAYEQLAGQAEQLAENI